MGYWRKAKTQVIVFKEFTMWKWGEVLVCFILGKVVCKAIWEKWEKSDADQLWLLTLHSMPSCPSEHGTFQGLEALHGPFLPSLSSLLSAVAFPAHHPANHFHSSMSTTWLIAAFRSPGSWHCPLGQGDPAENFWHHREVSNLEGWDEIYLVVPPHLVWCLA